ncbi:hypothetical protein RQN30_09060 [Arcanobacterium hippocoleae]
MANRKVISLRLDPAIYDSLARWANDDFRSVNAQIEVLLRDSLRKAGRLPKDAKQIPKRGRPKTLSSIEDKELGKFSESGESGKSDSNANKEV